MSRSRRGVPVRRIRFRRRVHPLAVLVVAILAAIVAWSQTQRTPGPPEALSEGAYEVERVIDGDTILLTNHARVRLIGVNTPETVKPDQAKEPWGEEAKEFTRQFVVGGQVRLEFDRERQDKYQRFLAYVWVGDQMLNEELIRQGLGRAEPGYRYSAAIKRRFLQAEQEAKAAGRGIWSGAAARPNPA
jgi:micrococcal nuclease